MSSTHVFAETASDSTSSYATTSPCPTSLAGPLVAYKIANVLKHPPVAVEHVRIMKVMGLPQTRAVIIILVLSFQLASADQSVDVQERKEWLESKLAWAEMRIVELELALYACKANVDLRSEDNRGANESAPRTLLRATSARLSVYCRGASSSLVEAAWHQTRAAVLKVKNNPNTTIQETPAF